MSVSYAGNISTSTSNGQKDPQKLATVVKDHHWCNDINKI